jgi:hypothetical protein
MMMEVKKGIEPSQPEVGSSVDDKVSIAWCGWEILVPPDWRPLRIEGELAKGSMMLGDADKPILRVQWHRVDAGSLNASGWITGRLKKLKAAVSPDAPVPKGIDASAWALDVHVREGDSKDVWYGSSSAAGIILEVMTVNLDHNARDDGLLNEIVSSLSVTGRDEPCRWSMYGISFVSPAGFELVRKHLFSGDIALTFKRGRKEALLLRQVYPAGIAISRRPLDKWIDRTPFTERRKPVKDHTNEWERGRLCGRHRRGWRRLPSPLGWCNPRYSTAVAAVDEKLDRLLIVEHLTRNDRSANDVDWCLEKMNDGEKL